MGSVCMMELYPYQIDCKEALRDNLRRGVKRQVLCAPTGSGKTVVAMSIVQDAMNKGSRVVFICDRQTLVNQTSDRFKEFGIPHGVAMGEHTFGRSMPIQVASAQTLEKRGFLTSGFEVGEGQYAERSVDLCIIDECHEVRKHTVEPIMAANIPLIGLSATPFTKGVGKVYQTVVNVITTNQLLNDKYLAPIKVVAPEAEIDTDGLTISNTGEWVQKEVSRRVKTIVGDIVPEWERQTKIHFGGPVKTIAFGATVADCEAMAESFQVAGYDFRVVHYKQSSAEKQAIIERFRNDIHIGLISCIALTKGFDVPETQCMIDAQPLRKSRSLHIQKIGRIMRTAPGKEWGLLIDHAGNYLGFYDETQAFWAAGCKDLTDEEFGNAPRKPKTETEHMRCKECGFILADRADACPSCGATRPRKPTTVIALPGSMKLIDEVTGKKGTFQGDWWTELRKVATGIHPMDYERARKMAVASYKGLFGEWPKGKFELTYGEPHPVVQEVSRRKYQQWLIAKRKGKAA